MKESTEKRPYEKPVMEMCGSMVERTLNRHRGRHGPEPGCISGGIG